MLGVYGQDMSTDKAFLFVCFCLQLTSTHFLCKLSLYESIHHTQKLNLYLSTPSIKERVSTDKTDFWDIW